MAYRQFNLLRTRRFWPLFATQFLGAFNDNLYKNALVILITYRLGATAGVSPELLVTAAAGIFILPFFVFSGVAGELADRYDKAMLIRWTKIAEVLIMTAGMIGFALGNVWFLLGVLLLMGVQSAFFGPLKYGILPDHLEDDELVGGNALIEAATFLAILAGTIIGGLIVLKYGGIVMVSAMTVMVAIVGYGASHKILLTRAGDPSLKVHWNPLTATARVLVHVAHNRAVLAAVIGIAWFWFLGSAYMAQFPNLAKGVLSADESVVILFLMVFSAGIGAGSLLAGILLHGQISARLVPWAGAAMALFSLDLLQVEAISSATLRDIPAFLASIAGWRLLADLCGLSLAAGLYVVPLYAILQTKSDPAHRARAIAGLNIIDAAFMVASSLLGVAALALGVSVPIFLALAGAASLSVALVVTWGVKPSARH